MDDAPHNQGNMPFGEWLLQQSNRTGYVGELAASAKNDPKFPKAGTPEQVRARLREVMAEGDMFDAVDDAEADWTSC
ncbi:hypothetical protein [Sphingomonas sp. KR3-1]|uniref:hypothetical protein n=1 Tax=Sphingomonas sp. KR3-1 TaxID=3156611 RepID=UPI0032B61A8C